MLFMHALKCIAAALAMGCHTNVDCVMTVQLLDTSPLTDSAWQCGELYRPVLHGSGCNMMGGRGWLGRQHLRQELKVQLRWLYC
jgi:hypothetical protein